jgi:hypothetical protein
VNNGLSHEGVDYRWLKEIKSFFNSYELRVGNEPAARAFGETAERKSAAREKEQWACLFSMKIPAGLT